FLETDPDVKLLKALDIGIKEKIPQDPFASHFILQKPLHKYGRLKKMGLPARYRLFFRAFKEQKIIIVLWLGFPRKEGDNNDCYHVFSKKVADGDFPENVKELLSECKLEDSVEEEASARQAAEQARQVAEEKAQRLAAKLRELNIEPDIF
ncbi:MAG: type II toxin-antitoxin system YhaV family toxin, partial [Rhizonema sp. NSF051]|nr:type II toxin-antitoxin system YhaV family toxin [Rhizonema sp. NSF051]